MVGDRDVDQVTSEGAVAWAGNQRTQVSVDRKDLVVNNIRLREDHLKCMDINKGVLTGHQYGRGS